jgi:hypothetical protein
MKNSDHCELNFQANLTTQLEKAAADAFERLNVELAEQNGLAARLINTQFRLEGELAGPIGARRAMGYDYVCPNLLSIIHRNLIQCCVALQLNNQGFYGAAGCLLRSLYEGLVVAKYCAISEDNSLFNHWYNGGDVFLSSQVFKKLAKPDVAELKRFWRGLCEWTHAGPGWGQALIGYEHVRHRVALFYTPLFMILDCNFHLLNRQLANSSVVYLVDRYKDGKQFRKIRESAKQCVREVRTNLHGNSLRLVKDFATSWQIKNH